MRDGAVLDLRYEVRDIDQDLTSPQKVDKWFEAKTSGLTDVARVQLKKKWVRCAKCSPAAIALRRS